MSSKAKQIIFIAALLLLAAAIVLSIVIAKKSTKSKDAVRVACVGDSITYGYGLEKAEAYPAKLQALLGEGYEVRNFGINGATVRSNGSLPYMYENYYRESTTGFEPQIVILMLGTNDSVEGNWEKEEFRQDYRFLLESYYALPCVKEVYVMLPPPIDLDESLPGVPRDSVLKDEVIPAIKEAVSQRNVGVIDLYSLFEGKPELLSDGCHPTAEAAALIAQTVYETLTENPTAK